AILARRDALCQATVRRGVARVPEGDRRLSALGQAGGFVAEDRLLQLRAEALERRACGARARDARVSRHDRRAARGDAPRAPRAGGGLSVVAASPGELRSSDAAACQSHGDLPFDPGRSAIRRLADDVRSADRLPAALPL